MWKGRRGIQSKILKVGSRIADELQSRTHSHTATLPQVVEVTVQLANGNSSGGAGKSAQYSGHIVHRNSGREVML